MFINGLTRWGRKPTPSAMNAFRNALSGWHQRMDALPLARHRFLGRLVHYGWHTMDYRPGTPMLACAIDRPIHPLRLGTSLMPLGQRRSAGPDQLRKTGGYCRLPRRQRVRTVCGPYGCRASRGGWSSGSFRRRDGHGRGRSLGCSERSARPQTRMRGQNRRRIRRRTEPYGASSQSHTV